MATRLARTASRLAGQARKPELLLIERGQDAAARVTRPPRKRLSALNAVYDSVRGRRFSSTAHPAPDFTGRCAVPLSAATLSEPVHPGRRARKLRSVGSHTAAATGRRTLEASARPGRRSKPAATSSFFSGLRQLEEHAVRQQRSHGARPYHSSIRLVAADFFRCRKCGGLPRPGVPLRVRPRTLQPSSARGNDFDHVYFPSAGDDPPAAAPAEVPGDLTWCTLAAASLHQGEGARVEGADRPCLAMLTPEPPPAPRPRAPTFYLPFARSGRSPRRANWNRTGARGEGPRAGWNLVPAASPPVGRRTA